jgi:3-hydroxyisobutyrate dehydrogenase-like beta-hydroxyacid dehydrogenase
LARLKLFIFDKESMNRIGILHPGEMGVSIAASAIHNGHQVYWTSGGRSTKTRARAETHGLVEIGSLLVLCQTCEIIFSVCPPHVAEDVSASVGETGFRGVYVDANAISPQRAIRIGKKLESDIQFVDGGIIGGPAWKPGETWLYLSGKQADKVAACFSRGPLETRILGEDIGKASALKMCYAAYTKGTSALLSAILGVSEVLGVREELYRQWDLDQQGFAAHVNERVRRVTAKAWRFEGEMNEIASTFHEAGLPEGFHRAAAETFSRMASFGVDDDTPVLEDVLRALRSPSETAGE